MLTIRLTRKGKKNQPFFRVVVIDKRRSAKGGRAVEEVGYVNPLTKKRSLDKDRVLYWINNGAQPSATVHNLLIAEKIIDDKKINKSKSPKEGSKAAKAAEAAKAPAAAPAVETPAPAAEAPVAPVVEEKVAETPVEEPKA